MHVPCCLQPHKTQSTMSHSASQRSPDALKRTATPSSQRGIHYTFRLPASTMSDITTIGSPTCIPDESFIIPGHVRRCLGLPHMRALCIHCSQRIDPEFLDTNEQLEAKLLGAMIQGRFSEEATAVVLGWILVYVCSGDCFTRYASEHSRQMLWTLMGDKVLRDAGVLSGRISMAPGMSEATAQGVHASTGQAPGHMATPPPSDQTNPKSPFGNPAEDTDAHGGDYQHQSGYLETQANREAMDREYTSTGPAADPQDTERSHRFHSHANPQDVNGAPTDLPAHLKSPNGRRRSCNLLPSTSWPWRGRSRPRGDG